MLSHPRFRVSGLIIAHCLFFSIIAWLFLPNLDIDMFENYAWGQTLEWGSFKHPPFFVWVTRLWFGFFPTNNYAYFMLSYLNAGLGLWGIFCLSSLLLREFANKVLTEEQERTFLILVLVFACFSLPFNFYAAIFNADSILLSLWPWVTYAFFAAIVSKTSRQKWFFSLLLAFLSAASVLGKYFSIVLLLSLLTFSLIEPRLRAWYKTPRPYVVLLLFLLLFLPHFLWEFKMNFPFRAYLSHYLAPSYKKIGTHLLTFSLTAVYFFALSWVLWLGLRWKINKETLKKQSLYLNSKVLLGLVILPLMFTCLISLMADMSVMDRWAIPLWFALPILMTNLLSPELDKIVIYLHWLKWYWFGLMVFIGFLFGFSLLYSYSYLSQHHDYLEARKEMTLAIEKQFREQFPKQKLSWVGGRVWPDHLAPLSYYLKDHPRAIPGFPGAFPENVNPLSSWKDKYGILICGKKYADPMVVIELCAEEVRHWLRDKKLPILESTISYKAKGWRWHFLPSAQKEIRVFWLSPSIETTH